MEVEIKSDGSISFTNKRVQKWVTADTVDDPMDILSRLLTHNKDYRVVDTTVEGYTVIGDHGKEIYVHRSWFYPDGSIDEDFIVDQEENFDNLIRSDYKLQTGDYFKPDTLSEEQKEFLRGKLPVCNSKIFMWSGRYCRYSGIMFYPTNATKLKGRKVFFNDIFIEK